MLYRTLYLLVLINVLPSLTAAQNATLIRAMQDEMTRSKQDLQLETLEKPYFISYRIDESHSQSVRATFGSLLGSNQSHYRILTVEIRIGDYSFDNTNFHTYSSGNSNMVSMYYGGRTALPLEDNYLELRRQLWLATDVIYKKALEDLAKKRALLQNKTRTEVIDDFSREAVSNIESLTSATPMDLIWAQSLVRELSGLFRTMPHISTSRIDLSSGSTHTYFLNSEGTQFSRTTPFINFNVTASTQAADGMALDDFVSVYGQHLEELPAQQVLAARIQELGKRLETALQAPLVKRFTGPVLFEQQAAANLIVQGFVPYLTSTRKILSDIEYYSNLNKENPFLDKIGIRVLPEFLSLINAPDQVYWKKQTLIGHYQVDDDGVPAQRLNLIEKGVLNTLLTTRTPVRGINQSNGSRRNNGPAPANLLMTSKKSLSTKKMHKELAKLVKRQKKDYGIIIRRLGKKTRSNDGSHKVGSALEAYKVFRDGRQERIRNVQFSDISRSTFKDIIAVSKNMFAYNTMYQPTTPFFVQSGPSPMSIVLPESILFEDITIRPPDGEIPKPPVAKHPYFDQ